MPTSKKRIAANRANAAKSTGPTTATGKRNAARSYTRHGILANTVLIDNESRECFASLLNSFNADFQTVNHTERMLVEKMAVCHWHTLRIWALESAGIIHETRRQSQSETSKATDVAPTRTMLALRSLGDTDRHPDLLGRYEYRYDRQYRRAPEALQRLQQGRKPSPTGKSLEPAGQNDPKNLACATRSHSSDTIKAPAKTFEAFKPLLGPNQRRLEAVSGAVGPNRITRKRTVRSRPSTPSDRLALRHPKTREWRVIRPTRAATERPRSIRCRGLATGLRYPKRIRERSLLMAKFQRSLAYSAP